LHGTFAKQKQMIGYHIVVIDEKNTTMETTKFKTNIKCSACVAKVTPYLDETVGKQNWNVDLSDPARTLTIQSEVKEQQVFEALHKAGYKAEKV